MPIHGWIFEPEEGDLARRAVIAELHQLLDIGDLSPTRQGLFHRRVARFLVDNERGKTIGIRLGDQQFALDKSHADGHFTGEIRVTVAQAQRLRRNDKLTFTAITRIDDGRKYVGEAHLIDPVGLSVISDIDDTIKISEVTDRKAMLRRTFTEAFEPVPEMAQLYRRWAGGVPGAQAAARASGGSGRVAFHFVSSSPWQLYEPLSALVRDEDFPPATFHLKRFRLRISGVRSLMGDPLKAKPQVISRLLETYPKRKFILVGDSGEKDPEVYGRIAGKYPDQIVRILIRNVTKEPGDALRYRQAFDGIPPEKWQVFSTPAEILPVHDNAKALPEPVAE